ncbi:MAG: hypothetical protein WCH76_07560, partial [Candidatus Riflemargulisbacteria bacterium]
MLFKVISLIEDEYPADGAFADVPLSHYAKDQHQLALDRNYTKAQLVVRAPVFFLNDSEIDALGHQEIKDAIAYRVIDGQNSTNKESGGTFYNINHIIKTGLLSYLSQICGHEQNHGQDPGDMAKEILIRKRMQDTIQNLFGTKLTLTGTQIAKLANHFSDFFVNLPVIRADQQLIGNHVQITTDELPGVSHIYKNIKRCYDIDNDSQLDDSQQIQHKSPFWTIILRAYEILNETPENNILQQKYTQSPGKIETPTLRGPRMLATETLDQELEERAQKIANLVCSKSCNETTAELFIKILDPYISLPEDDTPSFDSTVQDAIPIDDEGEQESPEPQEGETPAPKGIPKTEGMPDPIEETNPQNTPGDVPSPKGRSLQQPGDTPGSIKEKTSVPDSIPTPQRKDNSQNTTDDAPQQPGDTSGPKEGKTPSSEGIPTPQGKDNPQNITGNTPSPEGPLSPQPGDKPEQNNPSSQTTTNNDNGYIPQPSMKIAPPLKEPSPLNITPSTLDSIVRQLVGKCRNMNNDPEAYEQTVGELIDILAATGSEQMAGILIEKAFSEIYWDLMHRDLFDVKKFPNLQDIRFPILVNKLSPSRFAETELDFSLMSHGIIIPGLTTERHKSITGKQHASGKGYPNLHVWVDMSGSTENPFAKVSSTRVGPGRAAFSWLKLRPTVTARILMFDNTIIDSGNTRNEKTIFDTLMQHKAG